MANFKIVRELAVLPRDKGLKQLLLALYSAGDKEGKEIRYIALSEQVRTDEDSPWLSNKKGITIRRGEIANIISALQSADFDAKSDGNGLSDTEYSKMHLDWV
jgi:hypothetical protein